MFGVLIFFSLSLLYAEAPPAGFEDLDESVTGPISVYYNGVFVKSVEATFTEESVTIKNPSSIVSDISALKPEYKKQVIGALTGELPAHENLVCVDKAFPVCSPLTPKNAGVIFDYGAERADLFINKSYVKKINYSLGYIPEPKSGISYFNHNGIVYDYDSKDLNYSLLNRSVLSYNSARVSANLDYFKSGEKKLFQINDLHSTYTYKNWDYSVGYLDTDGDSFIQSYSIFGTTIRSNLSTIKTDKYALYGTPIILLLTEPTQVNLYKDGRIVYSGFYQPGQAMVNTTSLPSGSYPLKVETTDYLGNKKERTIFYVKNRKLPPYKHPLYTFSYGWVDDTLADDGEYLPEVSKYQYLYLNNIRRVGRSWGIDASYVELNKLKFIDAGVFFTKDNYVIEPALLWGSDGDRGFSLEATASYSKLSYSLSARKMIGVPSDSIEDKLPTGARDPFIEGGTNGVFTVGYTPSNKSSHSLSLTYGIDGKGMKQYSAVYAYNRVLYSSSLLNINGSLSMQKAQTSWTALFNIVFNFRLGDDWRLSQSSSYNYIKSEEGANREYKPVEKLGWSRKFAKEKGDIQASSALSGTEVWANNASIKHKGKYVYSAIAFKNTYQEGDGFTNLLSGSLDSNFMTTFDSYHFGGTDEEASTGVLVHFKGGDKLAKFSIKNAGQKVGEVRSGETAYVPLDPYKENAISIESISEGFYHFDEEDRIFTLYPGNIDSLNWMIENKYILFAYVVNSKGEPVSNGFVEGGVDEGLTDEEGMLEVELLESQKTLKISYNEKMCTIHIPKLVIEDGYSEVDELKCQ